jgi:uncharacterized integral membrane protein
MYQKNHKEMTANLNINPKLITFLMFVLLVVIMIMFSGCGPTYHLKQAEKHINKAKLKGAKISNDSIFVEVPITVTEIRDSLIVETHTDTLRIVELCKEVIKEPSKAIRRLQEEIRPPIEIDTVYQLEFISKGAKINIPIHVRISDKNQVFTYSITSPGIKIDLPVTVPCETVKSGHTKWELIILAIIALIVGIVIGRFIRW